MSIKVLRIINRFNLGGITYNVSYLSRYLQGKYDTRLIGGPEEKSEASSLHIPQSLGLQPELIEEMRRSVNPFADLRAYFRIRRIIREFRPLIVHTHASKAGAIGRLAAIHCGVPVIVHTFHGHVFNGYFGRFRTAVYLTIERYLASKSTAVVAISALQQHELAEKYRIAPKNKIHVIPLGFDLKRFSENKPEKRTVFRKKYGLKEDEIVLGIIGRLVPIKNHLLFVKAASGCMKNSGKKVRAVIVGDGESRTAIISAIREHHHSFTEGAGEAGDFIFTSWIREVDEVLPGLDLVCLTSANEGTPVSLIEAQAAARYIVTTEVGGVRDILHPDCGMMSDPKDETAYTANLMTAIRNLDELNSKAGAAADEVIRQFSYPRLCDDMDRLYTSLLAGRS